MWFVTVNSPGDVPERLAYQISRTHPLSAVQTFKLLPQPGYRTKPKPCPLGLPLWSGPALYDPSLRKSGWISLHMEIAYFEQRDICVVVGFLWYESARNSGKYRFKPSWGRSHIHPATPQISCASLRSPSSPNPTELLKYPQSVLAFRYIPKFPHSFTHTPLAMLSTIFTFLFLALGSYAHQALYHEAMYCFRVCACFTLLIRPRVLMRI